MCAAENSGVTRLVGRSMPTLEAADKATGRVEYVGDITVPNMTHAKIVRSPFAHARIVSIDASEARAMPGVVCVFTRDELREALEAAHEVDGFALIDCQIGSAHLETLGVRSIPRRHFTQLLEQYCHPLGPTGPWARSSR